MAITESVFSMFTSGEINVPIADHPLVIGRGAWFAGFSAKGISAEEFRPSCPLAAIRLSAGISPTEFVSDLLFITEGKALDGTRTFLKRG